MDDEKGVPRCGLCRRRVEGNSRAGICHRCVETGVKPGKLEQDVEAFVQLLRDTLAEYRIAYAWGYDEWTNDNELVSGGDHSDPTFSAATDPAHARARAHVAHAALILGEARAKVDHAKGELLRALPNEYQEPETDSATQTPSCVNCFRYGIDRQVYAAARCEPCYRYRSRNDLQDAPESVIREREWSRASRLHERRAS